MGLCKGQSYCLIHQSGGVELQYAEKVFNTVVYNFIVGLSDVTYIKPLLEHTRIHHVGTMSFML